MLIVVLLPAPLGPSSPKISPLLMSKEMPFTASILSKVLTRLSTCTSAGRPSFGRWIGPVLGGYDSGCSTIITPSLQRLCARWYAGDAVRDFGKRRPARDNRLNRYVESIISCRVKYLMPAFLDRPPDLLRPQWHI